MTKLLEVTRRKALHYLISAVDKWERGEYSDQTLLASYNLYKSKRGRVSNED